MNLVPITGKTESRAAFLELRKVMKKGATSVRHDVGYPSGHAVCTVHWHPEYGFWAVLDDFLDNRFWCGYGSENPLATNKGLNISCEINPPRKDMNGRCAGVFLRDSAGNFYLAHTGRIGGGKQGVGKLAFLDYYSGDLKEIEWPNGESTELIVIGKIGGRGFMRNLAHYVRTVDAFKSSVDGDRQPVTEQPELRFKAEFKGKRKKYAVSGAIESESYHGTVVDALRSVWQKKALKPYNTKRIDLYLVKGKTTSHIFEVKTDCLTGSLYQAVGQVMLHGALKTGHPKRILVLPEQPDLATKQRLDRIGVNVLTYTLNDGHVSFANVAAVL